MYIKEILKINHNKEYIDNYINIFDKVYIYCNYYKYDNNMKTYYLLIEIYKLLGKEKKAKEVEEKLKQITNK